MIHYNRYVDYILDPDRQIEIQKGELYGFKIKDPTLVRFVLPINFTTQEEEEANKLGLFDGEIYKCSRIIGLSPHHPTKWWCEVTSSTGELVKIGYDCVQEP